MGNTVLKQVLVLISDLTWYTLFTSNNTKKAKRAAAICQNWTVSSCVYSFL